MFFGIAKGFWTEFGQIPTKIAGERSEVRRVSLQTTSGPAHALRPIEIERRVPELTGDMTVAAQQLSVNHDANTQTISYRNVGKIVGPALASFQPELGQRASACGILDMHRQPSGRAQPLTQVDVGPTEGGSFQNAAGPLIDHALHHDANSVATLSKTVVFRDSADPRRQILHELRHRENRVVALQRQFPSRQICEH